MLDSGIRLHEPTDIHAAAVIYFEALFSAPSSLAIPVQSMDSFITKSISSGQAADLLKIVSPAEIKETIFRKKAEKAPGPDGFSASFFQKAWHIVGEEVTQVVLHFFHTGRLLKELNHTSLTLVPKVPNPSTFRDFRPIAYCNFLFKCISGILAARLKAILPSLIDEAQTTFIPSRSMSSNIFIAQELFRNYHRPDTRSRCAINVDLHKSFDTVKWDFLMELLFKLGFPPCFIGWVRGCITSPKYSININGEFVGFFGVTRGLRQGGPLSPYLFTIIMDALSMLISKNIEVQRLAGNPFDYH